MLMAVLQGVSKTEFFLQLYLFDTNKNYSQNFS